MDLRVDSHQHFWRVSRGDYAWLNPDDPALAPLLRDFAPADLRPLAQAAGVVQTVLVQAADTSAETDFLLDIAARHELVAGVVGWVDMTSAESVATLERWSTQPKFKGIRPMLQDLGDADWITHRPHPEVLSAIARLGLRFVQRHPELPVVIDHAAKPQLAQGWDAPWAAEWRTQMKSLAALPQVHCKFSGLLTEAAPAALASVESAVDALRPVWHDLLAWFGPDRVMWGSDWPVLTLAASYPRWVAVSEVLIGELSAAPQLRVWQDNARRFYALDDAA